MTRKKSLQSAAFALLAIIGSACSDSSPVESNNLIDPASVSGEILILNDATNQDDKQALRNAGSAFTAEYTNVSIRYQDIESTELRSTIIDALSSNAPDIVNWYPGNRMKPLIDAGLLDDISGVWSSNNLTRNMSAYTSAFTSNGKQWGIPLSTYGTGVYYRKDIFTNLGISVPTTWEEFKSAAESLKSNGIVPLTIGTQFQWPTGLVFDYLNLRINGYDVHNALTAGSIKYTDERIRSVFSIWKDMVDNDYFIQGHENLNWQDAVGPLANGDAAMYIIGAYVVDQFERAGGSIDNLGFFQFPEISSTIARAEEAPVEAFFLPSNASNKEAARAFLAFVSRPEVQSAWNETIQQIPPHKNAQLTDNRFIAETAATVNTASSLSQFFDRDAPAAMAQPAFEGFKEFMLDTTKLESVLIRLDEIQDSAY